MIVFDEATSCVDEKTEMELIKAMQKLTETSTVIFSAHRLTSAMNSDKIMVIDKGTVAEFDELSFLMNNPKSKFSYLKKLSSFG